MWARSAENVSKNALRKENANSQKPESQERYLWFFATHFTTFLFSSALLLRSSYLHRVCNVPVEIAFLQSMLERQEYDALRAIRAIFGEEIPRVIQGVRL